MSLCLEPNVSSSGTHKFFVLKCIFFSYAALSKFMSRKRDYACVNWIRKSLYCLPNMRIRFWVRDGGEIFEEFWNSQISKANDHVSWNCPFFLIHTFSIGIVGYIISLQGYANFDLPDCFKMANSLLSLNRCQNVLIIIGVRWSSYFSCAHVNMSGTAVYFAV